MSIFKHGNFTLHSGEKSVWKIDCDDLTAEDWDTLALMGHRAVGVFSDVVCGSGAATQFAFALERYQSYNGPLLIVDDVLTTGATMEKLRMEAGLPGLTAKGLVAFARGPCPDWVRPLFRFVGDD